MTTMRPGGPEAADPKSGKEVEAIRTLVAQYAHHLLHGRGTEMAGLYAADGRFIVYKGSATPVVNLTGRENIASQHKDMKAGSVFPLVTNHIVEVDGENASGTCVMFCVRPSPEGSPGAPFYGEYKDQYVRIGGRWLFQERNFTYYS